MPGNFRTSLEPYQSYIPEVCFSLVTAALKARLKLDEKHDLACMVVTATSQGNILIFFQQKLVKCCQLPFKDCFELILYHSFQSSVTKEFLIAVSFTKGCVVIDLQTLSVVKAWPDAKQVEIKDEKLLGYPQVILHMNHDGLEQEKIIVTHESDWKVNSKEDLSSLEGDSVLNSVAEALEAQAKKVQGGLLLLEKQISLRQSLANRALTALNAMIMSKANSLQPPSYTTKLGKGEFTKSALESVPSEEYASPVETSGIWQFLECITDSWVIGGGFTNRSGKTLTDIMCCFVPLSENMEYRVNFYVTGKVSRKVQISSTGSSMQELMDSSKSFNGKLDHNASLIVVVTTSIPRFVDVEEEVGNLFLTCKMSSNPVEIFQSSLGTVRLHFSDFKCHNIDFCPTTTDLMSLRRNILGLISLLTTEEDAIVSTIVSSAFRSFKKATQKLNMEYLASMQCFYSLGAYGYACILVLENNANSVKIQIRAHSERRLQWFIRHLKSVLSDDCSFAHIAAQVAGPKLPIMNHLDSTLAMLLNAEVVSNEPELIEERGTPVDDSIEEIRKQFLKKQDKLLKMNKEQSGNVKIAIEHYRHLQRCWFE